ncbi:DEAD/DEAH box helicase family protein [Haloactinopolyspora alba]|nr:DEAD/DEAH box helicase family protein [Haloactinopolyspora alba]
MPESAPPAEPDPAPAAAWATVTYPRQFRTHQRQALDAIDTAVASGARRAWVVLPPGAGKTLVGLEAARRVGRPIVAFGPNTAIQGQWLAAWREFTPAALPAGTARDLSAPVTALTYQSLANFDPDAEVDEDGRAHLPKAGGKRRGGLRDRLHDNGRALVEALENAGPVTLVLDECHHLLEVWGRLLAELLEDLPQAHVIGLTGTPPDTLTAEQSRLVDELFGSPLYSTSIPSVVREGNLAPFAELAWFTEPTPTESQWLAAQAERFAELRTDLLEADTEFLPWLDRRFVSRPVSGLGAESPAVAWSRVERDEPERAAAALRFHHAGLLALPPGAALREEHRVEPTADDWVALLGEYLTARLLPSSDPDDQAVVEKIRAALPSVGYQLTKRGIRRGRSPVDRVLARSEAKTDAAAEIMAAESDALGSRLRGLVLCDHERASATLPARLRGVLDAEAGSARLVLSNLLADPRTAALEPVLITGRAVAADAGTARKLVAFVAEHAPEIELDEILPDAVGAVDVTGQWSSRRWVPLVTRFYETGAAQVLVGTRALLGEGWDARGVNTLVDLTTATTPTAVVQTRGRALRVDPEWPEKVANTWTVVCVSEEHPGGAGDWHRFVRKHHGYFAVTDNGEIASGVGHVDPWLSPYAPPPASTFADENEAMCARAQNRARVRELWQVGTPYRDELVHTIRVIPTSQARRTAPREPEPGAPQPPSWVSAREAARRPWPDLGAGPAPPRRGLAALATAVALIVGAVGVVAGLWWLPVAMAAVPAAAWWRWVSALRAASLAAGRELAALADGPDPLAFGYAVADAMQDLGLSERGADAVSGVVEADGSYTIALNGVDMETSRRFTTALDEVFAPLTAPRWVIARFVTDPLPDDDAVRAAGLAWLRRTAEPNAIVYHAVPAGFSSSSARVNAFVHAWNRWVSTGLATMMTGPVAESILATHRGADPFAATTALRIDWS